MNLAIAGICGFAGSEIAIELARRLTGSRIRGIDISQGDHSGTACLRNELDMMGSNTAAPNDPDSEQALRLREAITAMNNVSMHLFFVPGRKGPTGKNSHFQYLLRVYAYRRARSAAV